MWANGSFYWNELMTRDAEAAKRFYGATLGWTFEPMQSEGAPTTYWVAKSGDEAVAGILQMDASDDEDATEGWFGYVAVKDLSTALARVTRRSVRLIRPPSASSVEVPGSMRSTPWNASRPAPPSTTASPEASRNERVGPLRFGPPTRNRQVSPSDSETTGAAKSCSSLSWCSDIRAPGS